MASLFSPFRRSYNYMYRSAHEYPAIFYSVVLGCLGPILVVTVPRYVNALDTPVEERKFQPRTLWPDAQDAPYKDTTTNKHVPKSNSHY